MEYRKGAESATMRSAEPFTIKMPISRDDLEPIHLHVVRSSILDANTESSPSVQELAETEALRRAIFLQFCPNSERNRSLHQEKALKLRYSTDRGTLYLVNLPMVAKKDIRIELHEHQITLIALARERPEICDEGCQDHHQSATAERESKLSIFYTFNAEAKNVFAIAAGYKQGQVQIFFGGNNEGSDEKCKPNLQNNRR